MMLKARRPIYQDLFIVNLQYRNTGPVGERAPRSSLREPFRIKRKGLVEKVQKREVIDTSLMVKGARHSFAACITAPTAASPKPTKCWSANIDI